jgi:hypothetical protein
MSVRIDVGMQHARREADGRGAEGVQWRESDVEMEGAALEGCVCLFIHVNGAHFSSPSLNTLLLQLLLKPNATHRSLNTTPPLKLTPHTSVSQFTPPSPSTTASTQSTYQIPPHDPNAYPRHRLALHRR